MYFYYKINYRIYKNDKFYRFNYIVSYLELAVLIYNQYQKHKSNFVIEYIGPVRILGGK